MEPSAVAIFILFSPLWWALVVGGSALIIWALEKEKGLLASVVLLASILAMTFFGNVPTFAWIAANPLLFTGIAVGYVAVGAGWGLVRWWAFNSHILEEYEEDKMEWLHARGVNDLIVPDNLKAAWNENLKKYNSRWSKDVNGERKIVIDPYWWDYKNQIATWMAIWPWSFAWYVVHHFVKDVFKRIQRWLSSVMERITKFVFRNVHKDYEVPVVPEKPVVQEPAVGGGFDEPVVTGQSFGYTGRDRIGK